jgi:hypothetical protein
VGGCDGLEAIFNIFPLLIFVRLLTGLFVAATKGYIQQEVNFYDAKLFDTVRDDKEVCAPCNFLPNWI